MFLFCASNLEAFNEFAARPGHPYFAATRQV